MVILVGSAALVACFALDVHLSIQATKNGIPERSSRQGGFSEEINRQIEHILTTEDLVPIQRAYKRLYSIAGTEGVCALKFYPNLAISLPSAWEEVRITVAKAQQVRTGGGMADLAMNRFLGFVEGKLGTPVPDWWKKGLLEFHVSDGHVYTGIGKSKYLYHNTGLNLMAPANVSIDDGGKTAVLKIGQEAVQVPATVLEKLNELGKAGALSACVDQENWYVTIYRRVPSTGTIFCIDKKQRNVLWKSIVWGDGVAGHENPKPLHVMEILSRGDYILVFGGDTGCVYVQAFRKSDGKVLFYLSTTS